MITVYGDYASYPQITDPFDNSKKDNSAFVGAGFLSYRQKGSFAIGAEGFFKSQQNNVPNSDTTALASQSGFGVSIWAYVNFSETVQLVGRFDTADPNTNADNDGKSLILAGLQFDPVKNVSITPNVEVFTYQKSGVDSDIIPRITFYWQF